MTLLNKLFAPALVIAGLVAAVAPRVAAAEDGPTKIATINPSKVLGQMQETKDKNQSQSTELQNLEKEQKQKVDEIKGMTEHRDSFLKKGTSEYNDATAKILEKSISLKTWFELTKSQLARRHKEEIMALFDKIQAATAQIAQEKKIDLVMTDYGIDVPEDMESVSLEALHAMIRQKNVIYSRKGIDISAEVTARLDAQYKK
jgi:Skp family chaperone for outer membrane proteins